MQEPTFLILTALTQSTLHGYGLMQEIATLSRDERVPGPGTLYGALDRLSEQGLIVVDREEAVDGRLRRYYRITETGTTALGDEVKRLEHHVTEARTRLRNRRANAAPLQSLAFGGAA